jgi:hypothetical protein
MNIDNPTPHLLTYLLTYLPTYLFIINITMLDEKVQVASYDKMEWKLKTNQ